MLHIVKGPSESQEIHGNYEPKAIEINELQNLFLCDTLFSLGS